MSEFKFTTSETQKRRWREKKNKRKADRVARGLCTYCGGTRENSEFQLCVACREKKRTSDADHMNKGLCRNCGGERENKKIQHCNRCREAQKVGGLRKKYGITTADYDRMLYEQGGVCRICGGEETTNGGTLHVDHDEESGKVRGLLCGNCNRGIGCLQHSTKLLAVAIEYLEATEETPTCL